MSILKNLISLLREDMDTTRFALSQIIGKGAKDRDDKLAVYSLILSSIADDLLKDEYPRYFSRQLKVLARMLLKVNIKEKAKSISFNKEKNDE